jgi:hypothetical protein
MSTSASKSFGEGARVMDVTRVYLVEWGWRLMRCDALGRETIPKSQIVGFVKFHAGQRRQRNRKGAVHDKRRGQRINMQRKRRKRGMRGYVR